ncbi:hypothetical protein BJ878DRAFT_466523, partial [Calycina marina]
IKEVNLETLFADLPLQCVLLEDIDTACLIHTWAGAKRGRISLSALLSVISGAATERRVLIITTNHLEELDSALIRPGLIDFLVKFDFVDSETVAAIICSIYAPLDSDDCERSTTAQLADYGCNTRRLFQKTK